MSAGLPTMIQLELPSAPTQTFFGALTNEGRALEFLAPIDVVVSGPNATPEVKYVLTLAVVVVLAPAGQKYGAWP